MHINGNTELIAHIGYPTHSFKSPMIYNPYFAQAGVNAVVVPMGCKPEDYPAYLKAVFTLTNIRGALITMPHKVTTVGLLDEVTPTVLVAGACNWRAHACWWWAVAVWAARLPRLWRLLASRLSACLTYTLNRRCNWVHV
jgi:Shikimate dehydrogenase substrate binding domain